MPAMLTASDTGRVRIARIRSNDRGATSGGFHDRRHEERLHHRAERHEPRIAKNPPCKPNGAVDSVASKLVPIEAIRGR